MEHLAAAAEELREQRDRRVAAVLRRTWPAGGEVIHTPPCIFP